MFLCWDGAVVAGAVDADGGVGESLGKGGEGGLVGWVAFCCAYGEAVVTDGLPDGFYGMRFVTLAAGGVVFRAVEVEGCSVDDPGLHGYGVDVYAVDVQDHGA